jgi:hypothetical protein
MRHADAPFLNDMESRAGSQQFKPLEMVRAPTLTRDPI